MEVKTNSNATKRATPIIITCVLIVTSLLFSGCAHEMLIAKGPKYESSTRATYMILPFGDANAPKYRLKHQNATIIVRDALESAFMERGFKTIHCPESFSSEAVHGVTQTASVDFNTEQLNDQVTEQNIKATIQASLGKQGITEGQAVAAGRQNGADIVLFGVVTAFYRGNFAGEYTTVGFSVKAIDVETGEIAWKASLIRKVGFNYNYDPSLFAQKIARKLVNNLVGK